MLLFSNSDKLEQLSEQECRESITRYLTRHPKYERGENNKTYLRRVYDELLVGIEYAIEAEQFDCALITDTSLSDQYDDYNEFDDYVVSEQYHNMTPLSAVVCAGYERLAEHLIKLGANVNAPNVEDYVQTVDAYDGFAGCGYSKEIINYPIHVACENGQVDCIALLLEKGAKSYKDGFSLLPLHCAITSGSVSAVTVLLNFYRQQRQVSHEVERVGYWGKNVLHYAAEIGSSELIKLFLRLGANDGQKDMKSLLPIDYLNLAMGRSESQQQQPFKEAIKALTYVGNRSRWRQIKGLFNAVEKGYAADITRALRYDRSLLKERNAYGNTILYEAVYSDNNAGVAPILSFCEIGDINALCYRGRTALHLVATKNIINIARQLLEAGADVYLRDAYGTPAILAAAEFADIPFIALLERYSLLEPEELSDNEMSQYYNASLLTTDDSGRNVLHYAAAAVNGKVDNLAYFLNKPEMFKKVDDKDNYHRTPYLAAADAGNVPCLKILMERGVNYRQKDLYGRNAAHLAAMGNHTSAFSFLLDCDTNYFMSDVDAYERNILHLCAEHNAVDTAGIILAVCPNFLEGTDNKARTPLHIAARHGSVEMVTWLLGQYANRNAIDCKNKTPEQVARNHSRNFANTEVLNDTLNQLRPMPQLHNGHI